MKPNIKSPYFALSLILVVIFIGQTFVESKIVVSHVENGQSTASVSVVYWLGMLWVSLAALMFYKATKNKQSLGRYLLILLMAIIFIAPIAGIVYVMIVLLPVYKLAGSGAV